MAETKTTRRVDHHRRGAGDARDEATAAALAWRLGTQPSRCGICGGPSLLLDGSGDHPTCRWPREARQRPQAPPEPIRRARAKGLQVGVLGAHGLVMVDGTPVGPWSPGPGAHLGDLYALAARCALDQLWVATEALAGLGLPAQLEDRARLSDEGQAHPFAGGAAEGWDLSPPGALIFWTHGWAREAPAGSEERQARAVVFPSYDHRGPWARHRSAAELAGALGAFMGALGPWFRSPGTTATRAMRAAHGGTRKVELGPSAEPGFLAEGVVEPDWSWRRALTDAEAAPGRFVHGLDLNAAYLAQMGSVELGYGAADHLAEPAFDPRRVGYWRARPVRVDLAGLPDPFPPAGRARWRWYQTETLALAVQLGAVPEISEAWVWPHKTRWIEPWQAKARAARLAFIESGDFASRLALDALKACYRQASGWFQSTFGADSPHELYRPSWADAIRARTRVNLFRRIEKVAAAGGAVPFRVNTDAIYLVGDSADPAELGYPLTDALGGFRHLGVLPAPQAAAIYGRSGPALRDAIEGRQP